jgi:hypothetical protein
MFDRFDRLLACSAFGVTSTTPTTSLVQVGGDATTGRGDFSVRG